MLSSGLIFFDRIHFRTMKFFGIQIQAFQACRSAGKKNHLCDFITSPLSWWAIQIYSFQE